MKLLCYGFLLLPWLATAQLADPSDPSAVVPAVGYRSVFADTPTGVEMESADWNKANAQVGQFRRGHVDILKWEAEQEARRKSALPSGSKP